MNGIKKETRKINYLLKIIILICTFTIIFTNYIFSKQVVLDINDQMLENEYNKIGGKDNYLILKELQKKEIIGYLEKLKKENPELVEELKQKALDAENKTEKKYEKFSMETINDLKENTYIKGNTGALVSIIEFSDLECPFCITYHKKDFSNKILEKYKGNINYIFKNFPLPVHKNATKESEAAMCVKNLEGGEKYLEFINEIFNVTKGGGEGFDLNNLASTAEKIGVNKAKFEECYNNGTYKKDVENEFNQGLKIGINSVPSNLIINNETGEYILLSEVPEEKEFEKIIDEFLK